MKLNQMAFAKAHGFVGGVLYIACRVWAMVAPESLRMIGNSWFHTVDLTELPTKSLDLTAGIVGLVSFVILASAWGYFVAMVYNQSAKK